MHEPGFSENMVWLPINLTLDVTNTPDLLVSGYNARNFRRPRASRREPPRSAARRLQRRRRTGRPTPITNSNPP